MKGSCNEEAYKQKNLISNGVEGCLNSTYREFKKWLFDRTDSKIEYKGVTKTNIDLTTAPKKEEYPKGPLPYSSNIHICISA